MRRVLVLTIAMAVTLALTAPAGANSPPSDVDILVETGAGDAFAASGPAVDDGLICDSGTVADEAVNGGGFPSGRGFNVQVIKHFTCDDNSGEFFVNLQARIDFRKGTTFQWNVVSGTGDYEGLHGAGSGVGLPGVPCGTFDCILDIYDGGLHIDP